MLWGDTMNKIKIIDNGFIIGIGYGYGEKITESEFNDILHTVSIRPIAPTGFTYKLKANTLEWELVEIPVQEPEDEEAQLSDYVEALQDLGVDV